MRVALYNLTTTTKHGGVETFVWGLARELAGRGVEVDIIGGARNVVQEAPGVRIVRHAFIDRGLFRRMPGLKTAWAFTKLLERLTFGATCLPGMVGKRYDIIHIQKPYDLPAAAAVRRLSGSKLLFGCHGKDFFAGDRLFIPFIDGSVSCSRFNAGQVQQRYGIWPAVVYNGIDVDFFKPAPVDLELRRQWAGDEEKVILFAGRLVRWKGVEYIVQAMKDIAGHVPTKLVLAADGPYRDVLQQRAREHGVEDKVLFIGQIPHSEMPRYIAAADVVVGYSFANETFGIVLCEAMACERPVVASDFGGFTEVVEDGVTGLLAPPQNPVALAEKLTEILRDDNRRTEMGKAGRRRVVENYSWKAVGDNVMREYERILSR